MPSTSTRSTHDPARPRGRRRPGTRHLVAAAVAALAAVPAMALAAPPTLEITGAGPAVTGLSNADEVAGLLLGPGVTLDGPATINGSATPGDYAANLPSFGRFTEGTAELGVSDGLVVTANAQAESYTSNSFQGAIAGNRTDTELFDVINAAGLCGTPSAAICINNATSVEFAVKPTARYLKFEYSLAITEYGSWNGSAWNGNVFGYPDGFALFVGGRDVAANCAVVPGTSTYLTMQTAGVVAPLGSMTANRAVAQANLEARIADPAAPNGFAYATENSDWTVRFVTVPLTCVADVDADFQANTATSVKVVVADANDSAIPPAVFLKGGSVRFSDDAAPIPEPERAVPDAPGAPQVTEVGDGEVTVSWDVPGDGGSAITGYTVTSEPGGVTCSAVAPATSCTVTGLENGTEYTFTVTATNAEGTGAASAPSAPATPKAAPAPPTPQPQETPAEAQEVPVAPQEVPQVKERIVTPLAPPSLRAINSGVVKGATLSVHRIQFDEVGRYTFIYFDRATGKRVVQLPGSRIGRRVVNRRASAPVLNNQRPGKRLVVAARFAKESLPADGSIGLRIVLKRPDGSLHDVTVGQDGTLG